MTLELLVGGARYSGWTGMRVTRGMERAAADFSLTLSERWPERREPWRIVPGEACRILIDGETVITGYTDSFEVALDAGSHTVSVAGRSKTADLIDCSADIPGGQFRGFTPAEIAASLAAPFGVEVRSEIEPEPVGEAQIQQGDTPFEILERLSRLQGFLVGDTPEGHLRLYRIGTDRADEALREGANLLTARIRLDHSQVHSEYRIKGQQPWRPGLGPEDLTAASAAVIVEGEARYRPLMIVAEAQADPAWCRRRAHWEAQRRAARALGVDVTVQGWRQASGALWRENMMVSVTSPALGLDGELVISEVEYAYSEAGEIAALHLTHPEAFEPEPAKAKTGRRRGKGAGAKGTAIDWTQYIDKPEGGAA